MVRKKGLIVVGLALVSVMCLVSLLFAESVPSVRVWFNDSMCKGTAYLQLEGSVSNQKGWVGKPDLPGRVAFKSVTTHESTFNGVADFDYGAFNFFTEQAGSNVRAILRGINTAENYLFSGTIAKTSATFLESPELLIDTVTKHDANVSGPAIIVRGRVKDCESGEYVANLPVRITLDFDDITDVTKTLYTNAEGFYFDMVACGIDAKEKEYILKVEVPRNASTHQYQYVKANTFPDETHKFDNDYVAYFDLTTSVKVLMVRRVTVADSAYGYICGVVKTAAGAPKEYARVKLTSGTLTYWTTADHTGRYIAKVSPDKAYAVSTNGKLAWSTTGLKQWTSPPVKVKTVVTHDFAFQ